MNGEIMVARSKKTSAVLPVEPEAFPSRVIIDSVSPEIDGGRFPAKCVLGRALVVEAIILCDGHEILKADLLYRHESETIWRRSPMRALPNDRYGASLTVEHEGGYIYTVEAAIDRFAGWRDGFVKKLKAGEASEADMLTGLGLMEGRNTGNFADYWRDAVQVEAFLNEPGLIQAMRADWNDPSLVRYRHELKVAVDPVYAVFSSWYEFFPRSQWKGIAEQGNLKDAADRLPYIADLGFDIVYLPPIHPIGEVFRKGKNNSLKVEQDDVGSPWAIGGKEGGHKSIHPALGTFEDFAALVARAKTLNLEIALDIAFQCSPDHPYVREHPEWFRKRPDGTIQYAENPPKKYQDIYPFDFESVAWRALWDELLSVLQFWIEKGVRVFRIDNPHTKSFAFWEWAIAEVRKTRPDVIFLAEAFTRPHVMAWLAKIGFSQSYTYFAWRQTKAELTEYMEELTQTELKDYFRPNFWPNTPDILTEALQSGIPGLYRQRLILAATLTSNYGIYGPVFELMDGAPMVAGKEEYLNSEKYQLREWDVHQPHSMAPLIRLVNRIRRENPALQGNDGLIFHPTDNDQIIAYTKEMGNNLVLTIVNLDRFNSQSGYVDLQIQKLGISPEGTFEVHDLLSDMKYSWRGWKNYVSLDPNAIPAHIFRVERKS
jgi:starch synthase (maltosyl-transferring)